VLEDDAVEFVGAEWFYDHIVETGCERFAFDFFWGTGGEGDDGQDPREGE
jgi:hypothetical protein